MKRLFLVFVLAIFVLSACSSHVTYLRNNPGRLTPGMKARSFLKAWGEPDDALSYHDFLNRYNSRFPGTIDPRPGSGSVSVYGKRSDYSYLTVVWIYEQQKKILFFEKGYLIFDVPGAIQAVWRLVGWENIYEPTRHVRQGNKTYRVRYTDGSRYVGQLRNGKRHGQGTYIWPCGDRYVGEWINDRAIGGWFYKTTGSKVWIYEDSEGQWVVKQ